MIRFSSLRARLVGTVFLAVAVGWLVAFFANLEIAGFTAGLLALFAAWFGGEHFIIRQVRVLLKITSRLASGDLSARTGFDGETGELGDLARTIDIMAGSLEQRAAASERAERDLRTRAQQQTAVAALGQFALTSNDFEALMEQAVMMVAETLEVEFCEILELAPDASRLTLRAGTGWKEGFVGCAEIEADPNSLAVSAIQTGEAVRVADYRTEKQFSEHTLLRYHGATSGVTVGIIGRDRTQPFGVLGAHSSKSRAFTDDDEQFLRAVANLLAMTVERKRAEAEMQKRAAFAQLNPTPAIEVNTSGEITYSNDATAALAHEIGHDQPGELLPPNIREIVEAALMAESSNLEFDTQLAGRTLSWSVHPVPADRLAHCYITDVTERLKMETSLRQAEKMMAIGQLAAGVAHDFNNMLTVIQGHSGILLQKADRKDGSTESAQAIYFAAERAAGLTRQLLMFSRKNVKQTADINLPDVVKGMSDMLKRLLGETITLELTAAESLPHVQADRNEIEQVIMNLVVNARDATPQGAGIVRIVIEPVAITAEDVVLQPQSRPGKFVRVQVIDTGCGMDQATIERIFEPFFTTKEVGKGTGLGLATVYGIVKQHDGWIEVSSAIGKGTTFNVFFPALEGDPRIPAPVMEAIAKHTSTRGTETVLVVEDEPELREMAVLILESCGYGHFEAGSGPEAEKIWEANPGKIDLVLTDMVMPGGMTGLQLAERLIQQRAGLPVVIASGYSVDDISDKLSANRNIRFVQKPYSPASLTQAIRTALDTHSRLTK
jgi:signal transduction histidine kinase/HAMP domain-containing protein